MLDIEIKKEVSEPPEAKDESHLNIFADESKADIPEEDWMVKSEFVKEVIDPGAL